MPRQPLIAGVAMAVAMAVSTGPAHASSPQKVTTQARFVAAEGPSRMILRPGCTQNYTASAVFDAVAGESYLAVIKADDGTGRSIDGAVRRGTVSATGRVRVSAPLLLCGSTHDPGTGSIKIGLVVGDTDVDLRKTVQIKFANRVSMRKPATRVRKGKSVRLRGVWSRGAGYPSGLTTDVRRAVKVRIYFKPSGRKWRYVTSTRIDSQGNWSKRVKVKKRGAWQARIANSDKLLPAKSKRYTVRVKR